MSQTLIPLGDGLENVRVLARDFVGGQREALAAPEQRCKLTLHLHTRGRQALRLGRHRQADVEAAVGTPEHLNVRGFLESCGEFSQPRNVWFIRTPSSQTGGGGRHAAGQIAEVAQLLGAAFTKPTLDLGAGDDAGV